MLFPVKPKACQAPPPVGVVAFDQLMPALLERSTLPVVEATKAVPPISISKARKLRGVTAVAGQTVPLLVVFNNAEVPVATTPLLPFGTFT